MSKSMQVIAARATMLVGALLSAVTLTAAAPVPASAASVGALHVQPVTAAFRLRGLSRRTYGRPSYRSRYGYRSRSPFHGIGGTILKGLGIAYLFHAVFGWGAGGGSPFGLLIVLALIAWLVTRRRRRTTYPY